MAWIELSNKKPVPFSRLMKICKIQPFLSGLDGWVWRVKVACRLGWVGGGWRGGRCRIDWGKQNSQKKLSIHPSTFKGASQRDEVTKCVQNKNRRLHILSCFHILDPKRHFLAIKFYLSRNWINVQNFPCHYYSSISSSLILFSQKNDFYERVEKTIS